METLTVILGVSICFFSIMTCLNRKQNPGQMQATSVEIITATGNLYSTLLDLCINRFAARRSGNVDISQFLCCEPWRTVDLKTVPQF